MDDQVSEVVARFGARLQSILDAKDWTQGQLSRRAKIPNNTLTGLLRYRREPKLSTLLKLTWALGISLDELVGVPSEEPQVGS